jgi:hypothetical protein
MSVAILLNLLIFRYDSVEYHIEQGEKDKAIELLQIIYPSELYQVHEEIYDDYRSKGGKKEGEKAETVGLWQAFTHVDYRSASWLVFYIMIAFNLSGIPLINIYTV